jgi:hypothetical protein
MKCYKAVLNGSDVVLCKKCTTLYKRLGRLTDIKKTGPNKKCFTCPN